MQERAKGWNAGYYEILMHRKKKKKKESDRIATE